MLSPAVLRYDGRPGVDRDAVCVIWRTIPGKGCDYFCRAPFFDVERIIWSDQQETGLANEAYEVKPG